MGQKKTSIWDGTRSCLVIWDLAFYSGLYISFFGMGGNPMSNSGVSLTQGDDE